MSVELYRELSWLPKPPADFPTCCKELIADCGDPGKQIRALATYALDERQLSRLGRAIKSVQLRSQSLDPLVPFRLGLIGNGTLELIAPVLVATAARHGFALECIMGGYDQFLQDALQPDSTLNKARPDLVLLAIDHRGLSLQPTPGNEEAANQTVKAASDLLRVNPRGRIPQQRRAMHHPDSRSASRGVVRLVRSGAAGYGSKSSRSRQSRNLPFDSAVQRHVTRCGRDR